MDYNKRQTLVESVMKTHQRLGGRSFISSLPPDILESIADCYLTPFDEIIQGRQLLDVSTCGIRERDKVLPTISALRY